MTPPSGRAVRTAALVGLMLDARGVARVPGASSPLATRRACLRRASAAAHDLLGRLPAGHIALVTGPSGAGKSTLLAAAAALGRRQGGRVVLVRAARTTRRVIDLAGGDLHAWLRVLSRCGLAEAGCLLRRADQLSTGQAQRLSMALALWKAARAAETAGTRRPRVLLLVDALGENLDRLTAASVCMGLRRGVNELPGHVRVIAASAHDDLAAHLKPHCHLALSPHDLASPRGGAWQGGKVRREAGAARRAG